MPAVMVKLDIATGPPETMETVLRFRSAPDVPTVPSTTAVLPEVRIRNHDAVPVASAASAAAAGAAPARAPAAA